MQQEGNDKTNNKRADIRDYPRSVLPSKIEKQQGA